MSRTLLFFLLSILFFSSRAQSDEKIIEKLFQQSLREGQSYAMLEYLSTRIGGRLSGSPQAAAAVEWTRHTLERIADTVWLQPVMVPHWVRGKKEKALIVNSRRLGTIEVNVCALGGSVATGASGIAAAIVEVNSLEELKTLGSRNIQGKIVFFNRPMDPALINTFAAYSGAVDQRAGGASEAARFGAVGVVVRSMGSHLEDYPHTGGLRYAEGVTKIPAVAISTRHAALLSDLLKEQKDLQFFFQTDCQTFPDAPSFNVIGEIRGSEFPDEFIVVGGHLDSWDLGQGAHDDGAGCVQAMEVLRLFKATGYHPKRTIRAVMYMNEENGLRGGHEYARWAEINKEKHLAAMESDRGGFTPRGFSMTATASQKEKIKSWTPLLEPYGLTDFGEQGGGADIGPLARLNVALLGFLPDAQRYFRYHHTEEDTFDKVDKRELELGAASMAAMIFLIDKNGL